MNKAQENVSEAQLRRETKETLVQRLIEAEAFKQKVTEETRKRLTTGNRSCIEDFINDVGMDPQILAVEETTIVNLRVTYPSIDLDGYENDNTLPRQALRYAPEMDEIARAIAEYMNVDPAAIKIEVDG